MSSVSVRKHPGQEPASSKSAERAQEMGHPAAQLIQPVADDNDSRRRLEAIYREHFDFVWRSALRLGVARTDVEDVVHDVFIVVNRRLDSFEEGGSMRAWLYGIVRRVAAARRRKHARRQAQRPTILPTDPNVDAEEWSARMQAVTMVRNFLDSLDEERRSVFVLAELEGWTGPEIAQALSVNLNTVYTRLRAARKSFDALRKRLDAREQFEARRNEG